VRPVKPVPAQGVGAVKAWVSRDEGVMAVVDSPRAKLLVVWNTQSLILTIDQVQQGSTQAITVPDRDNLHVRHRLRPLFFGPGRNR
jgi:hypothetical protein